MEFRVFILLLVCIVGLAQGRWKRPCKGKHCGFWFGGSAGFGGGAYAGGAGAFAGGMGGSMGYGGFGGGMGGDMGGYGDFGGYGGAFGGALGGGGGGSHRPFYQWLRSRGGYGAVFGGGAGGGMGRFSGGFGGFGHKKYRPKKYPPFG